MTTIDLRHAAAAEISTALDAPAELAAPELKALLANAFERIASLEHDRKELEQAFALFNEMMDAAKVHGPGVLTQQ